MCLSLHFKGYDGVLEMHTMISFVNLFVSPIFGVSAPFRNRSNDKIAKNEWIAIIRFLEWINKTGQNQCDLLIVICVRLQATVSSDPVVRCVYAVVEECKSTNAIDERKAVFRLIVVLSLVATASSIVELAAIQVFFFFVSLLYSYSLTIAAVTAAVSVRCSVLKIITL